MSTVEEVQQRPSHSVLLEHPTLLPALDWPQAPSAPLDAIVVPASRGAVFLQPALVLAARLDVQLVALCSLRTRASEVAALAEQVPGGRVVAIDVPAGYQHPFLPGRTSAPRFRRAGAGRSSDLSLKRNLGLLLARMHGWSKILFLDDDIAPEPGALDPATVRRLAGELDSHQVAGLVCRSFPDNSVVCHAHRLAGLPQDNFITGGALAVNCSDQPLPFFPDIYNEDWFFFARHAANRELAEAGEAQQAPYDPYADPHRARTEEFGDLLAEGLYALFDGQPGEMGFSQRLAEATPGYWEHFIHARGQDLNRTRGLLEQRPEHEIGKALRSLRAASDQLSRIDQRLCTDFIEAWQSDLLTWEQATQRLNGPDVSGTALRHLGLRARTTQPVRLLEVA